MKGRLFSLIMAFALVFSIPSYASELTWGGVPGHHNQSILLENGEIFSRDEVRGNARGEILASGMSEISNEQNGTLHIEITTFAHRNMDAIYQSVYLERWDEKRGDWVQINSWDFERTKEEEENLSAYSVGFTVYGLTVGEYYRVRGLHMVELNGEFEGIATETNGVKLTKVSY